MATCRLCLRDLSAFAVFAASAEALGQQRHGFVVRQLMKVAVKAADAAECHPRDAGK